jgi:hypothetical protein
VRVTFSGLSGSTVDWIALAPPGSPNTTVVKMAYTGGGTGGTIALESPGPGTFVARAFTNGTYTLAAETASFDVSNPVATTITDSGTYTTGQDITVSWTGLQGVPGDWVAIAPQGSPMTTITRWVYAGSQTAGSTTFVEGVSSAGTYVARTFSDNTYNLIVESSAFTVN